MEEQIILEAKNREALGKKVKQIRREGQVPGVIYGPDFDQVFIQTNQRQLRQVLMEAGGTQVVTVAIDGDELPTLVRDVQRDPLRGEVMHFDLYHVDLTKKINVEVPLLIVGMPAIVSSGEAVINQLLSSMEVESLPNNIPTHIEVDVTGMEEIGMVKTISDLDLPTGVEPTTTEDEALVKIDYALMEEIEEEEEEDLLIMEEALEPEVIREREDEEEDFEE